MKYVRFFLAGLIAQIHSEETRVGEAAIVVTGLITSQSRHRVNPDREQVIRKTLEKLQAIGIDLAELRQEIRITDLGEFRPLLFWRQSRQVIDLGGVNAGDVAPN